MRTIDDMNSRMGEIAAELEVLAGLTDPTDDDAARSAALLEESETLEREKQEATERRQKIAEAHARQQMVGQTVPGASFEHLRKSEPYDMDFRTLNGEGRRDLVRSILDRPESRHLVDGQKVHVERLADSLGDGFARAVQAGSRPEYRSAFAKYVTGNENLMTNDERRAVGEVRALGLAVGSGGYAVPPLLDPSIILTSDGSANPTRQVARTVTGMDNTWRGVSSAGITAAWDSQGVQADDNAPTLAQPTITAHKAQAFVPYSVEIEGDWGGLASEMSELFADAKDTLETAAHATGSGVEQPVGIITALLANSSVTRTVVSSDGELKAVDIRSVFGALGPRYRRNASWMMSIDVLNEIRGLDTTGGMSNQTVDLTAGYDYPLLGKPAYENSGFPDFTGTTGVASLLVVGDFRNYVVFDRVGSSVEFVQHLFGADGRPTGQRGLWFWWRTGADSVNDAAFRLLMNT